MLQMPETVFPATLASKSASMNLMRTQTKNQMHCLHCYYKNMNEMRFFCLGQA